MAANSLVIDFERDHAADIRRFGSMDSWMLLLLLNLFLILCTASSTLI
jgi:hypothetical protein